jgi:hypothetical protein
LRQGEEGMDGGKNIYGMKYRQENIKIKVNK